MAGSQLIIDQSIYESKDEEEKKMEALFGFDELMEKLIMLMAERNQSFLEKTLNALDAKLKGTRVSKLLERQSEYFNSMKNVATDAMSHETKEVGGRPQT